MTERMSIKIKRKTNLELASLGAAITAIAV